MTQRYRAPHEILEAIQPYLKWMFLALIVAGGGLGLTKLTNGPSTGSNAVVHPIAIKAILNNKPMPGANLTFTPILKPDQAEEPGSLSAELQRVGRTVMGADGTGTPSITPDSLGLPAGEYIASLTWCKVEVKDGESVAGPDRVPQIFRRPSTSTLRLTVKPGDHSLVTLNLSDPKVRAKRLR